MINKYIILSHDMKNIIYTSDGINLRNEIVNKWRAFFINNKSHMIEYDTPTILSYDLLKQSGHIDRFNEYIILDTDDNKIQVYNLINEYVLNKPKIDKSQIINMNKRALEQYINTYITNYKVEIQNNNKLLPIASNGMNGDIDFLRPDIVLGLLVNFKNSSILTNNYIGLAEYGKIFINETCNIPYIQKNETNIATIAYLYDPQHVFDILDHNNIIEFIKSIHPMLGSGLNIRVRDLKLNELDHNMNVCNVIEIEYNGSWINCCKLVNRCDYDIIALNKENPIKMKRKIKEKSQLNYIISINDTILRTHYKDKYDELKNLLLNLKENDIKIIEHKLLNNIKYYVCLDGVLYNINNTMINIKKSMIKIEYEDYSPYVYEMSFYIDNIIYILNNIFE